MQRYTKSIESLIRKCVPIPQKIYNNTKRLQIPVDEVEKYFPGFMTFIGCTEQQIPQPANKRKQKIYYSLGKKKRHTVKTQFMVNNPGIIINKANHKKEHNHDYDIYKNNHPATVEEVVNVFDSWISWT